MKLRYTVDGWEGDCGGESKCFLIYKHCGQIHSVYIIRFDLRILNQHDVKKKKDYTILLKDNLSCIFYLSQAGKNL